MKLGTIVILLLFGVISCSACGEKTQESKSQDQEGDYSIIEESQAGIEAETEDLTEADTPILLEMPSFQYYVSDKIEKKENVPLQLNLVTETTNAITDEEAWFADNELSLPTYEVPNSFQNMPGNLPEGIAEQSGDLIITSVFYDDDFIYCIYGADFSQGYILKIYDAVSLKIKYFFDFSNYCYSPEYVESDYDFIQQRITWAAIKDNILYISSGHNTYAQSSNGMNAYLTAIDLSDHSVLWRSNPLVSNAQNFQIVNDVILCGYGFTDEADYLYQIALSDGKVLDKIPLKSAASFIIQKGKELYVRTYNKNYIFEIIS